MDAALGPQFITQLAINHWASWLFAGLGGVAAVTDYRSGKIYNWLTLPALAFAVVLAITAAFVSHPFVLALGLAGFALVAVLFVPLFAFGVVGGGDVKLLLALGTALGWKGTLELIVATLVIAGAGAFVILLRHGRAPAFFKELWLFLRSLYIRGLEIHWPLRLSTEYKAPFGIAIFLGYVYVQFKMGVWP